VTVPIALLALGLSVASGGWALRETQASWRRTSSPFRRVDLLCERFSDLREELPAGGVYGYISPFVLRTRASGDFAGKREFIQNLRGRQSSAPEIDARSYLDAKAFIRRMRIVQYCMAPCILDAGSASASGDPLPFDPDTTIADFPEFDQLSEEFDLSAYVILRDYGGGLLLLAERHQ
jgi:hypothetical protein